VLDGVIRRTPLLPYCEHVYLKVENLDIVVIDDALTLAAMRRLLLEAKLLVEPSGAISLAAIDEGLIVPQGGPTAAILTEGNVAPALIAQLLTEA
jgi:threonine dehydratase